MGDSLVGFMSSFDSPGISSPASISRITSANERGSAFVVLSVELPVLLQYESVIDSSFDFCSCCCPVSPVKDDSFSVTDILRLHSLYPSELIGSTNLKEIQLK